MEMDTILSSAGFSSCAPQTTVLRGGNLKSIHFSYSKILLYHTASLDSNLPLFDAPSRQTKKSMKWLAHSFLAVTPFEPEIMTDLGRRRITPLLGFSWGFDIDAQGKIELHSIS